MGIEQQIIEDAFSSFKQELQDFFNGEQHNVYVYGGELISVYTRKGRHYINGTLEENCLDIANISIAEEFQQRGLGLRVIDYMHRINPYEVTFIESILNEHLEYRLRRDGWQEVEHSVPLSVYKPTLSKGK